MNNSQIETTPEIGKLVSVINGPANVYTLLQIRDLMYSKLMFRDNDEENEKVIRWKRTAGEILRDGYVYSGRACTDLVVLFISLCKALGLETRFVKVKNGEAVHSIAEIKLTDGWYIFDISRTGVPIKGEITADRPHQDWQLWGKGRDAWDLGLTDFDSITKIIGSHNL